MFKRKKVTEAFLKLSMEHVQVLDHIQKLQDVLNGKKTGMGVRLRKEAALFARDMRRHFELEEMVLFPTAMICIPALENIDRVLVLQKEHGAFETEMDDLLEVLTNPAQMKKRPSDALIRRVQSLIRRIRKHADIEMRDLFPRLDDSRRAQKIIRGFVS
ncbi:hemerythrin domain-containing protein [bacterium]|nr:hemerythrin domain-containing protein [bacterium]